MVTTTVVEDEPPSKFRRANGFRSKPITPAWRAKLLDLDLHGEEAIGVKLFRTLPRPKKMTAAYMEDGHPGATPPSAPVVSVIDEKCQTPGPDHGASSPPLFQF